MITHHDYLVYFAIKCNGDRLKILEASENKKLLEIDDIDVINTLSTLKSKAITILDEDYPEYLKRSIMPPLVLFYYGDISLLQNPENNIAVVGSRNHSEYGVKMTTEIVKDICPFLTIVSGMAIGIDTVAQTTAIENGGKTIAVLPSGIDYCYPIRNRLLYEEIKKNHLIISEYPNDLEPTENNFRCRNRIVAAISKAVVVTEAKHYSGTLITVGVALQSGKDIYCVPYHGDEESHCNRLIKEGAVLVECGDDILYDMKKIHH